MLNKLLFFQRWYHYVYFLYLGKLRCKRVDIGYGNYFEVPVRGDGSGILSIGSNNGFGFKKAPRFSKGEILIQARHRESYLEIGSHNIFSNNVSIIATEKIIIGNDCLIGDRVTIVDSDFHAIDPLFRKKKAGPSKPVNIGNNVWIGTGAMVLKGVVIGDNSVIGAMSLVNKSIPADCIAAGNPARVIRRIE